MPANLYGWLKRMLPCKQEYFKHIFGWFYFYERCMNFAKDLFINKLLSSLSKDASLMNFPYSDIAQNMSFNPPPFFLMGTVWIVTIIWQFFSAAAAALLCFRQDNRSVGEKPNSSLLERHLYPPLSFFMKQLSALWLFCKLLRLVCLLNISGR